MTEVVLDTEGRLTGFVAVPPRLDEGDGRAELDWTPALTEAGSVRAAAACSR